MGLFDVSESYRQTISIDDINDLFVLFVVGDIAHIYGNEYLGCHMWRSMGNKWRINAIHGNKRTKNTRSFR